MTMYNLASIIDFCQIHYWHPAIWFEFWLQLCVSVAQRQFRHDVKEIMFDSHHIFPINQLKYFLPSHSCSYAADSFWLCYFVQNARLRHHIHIDCDRIRWRLLLFIVFRFFFRHSNGKTITVTIDYFITDLVFVDENRLACGSERKKCVSNWRKTKTFVNFKYGIIWQLNYLIWQMILKT